MKERYEFLWTEPGWVLVAIPWAEHRLTAVFEPEGASVQDVARLRQLMPDLPLADALAMTGAPRVPLGLVSATACAELCQRAAELGIDLALEDLSRTEFQPMNERTGDGLIIDDEDEARAVVDMARAHGVPCVEASKLSER